MGVTAYFYPVKEKNKSACFDFMQGTIDLSVFQKFMRVIHQAEYQKYQEWCERYCETLTRYEDIFDNYDVYMQKMEEWEKDNPSAPNPEEGLNEEEQQRFAEFAHRASYKRLDEIASAPPLELNKPHWLCNYLRKKDYELLNSHRMELLSYADIKLIVDKLKMCADAKTAEREFPAIGYYDDESYWKWKLSDGLSTLENVLKTIGKDDFVMYIEL